MSRAALVAIAFASASTGCGGRYPNAPREPLADPPVAELQPSDEARAIDLRTEEMKRADLAKPKESVVTTSDDWKQDIYAEPRIAELIARIDPHEYERWPLSHNQHPALEPAYAIANVFASTGVSWTDLCRMGAQNRRGGGNTDQLEYLRAWCDVAKREAGAAVARLKPLVNSSVLGMPAAVRTDIANIVVDAGDADHAQRLLSRAQVDDLAVFDLAAAGYVEVGKVQDALDLTHRAIAAHDARRPQDHCMRVARKVVLVDPDSRMPLIRGLGLLQHCGSQYGELLCWHKKDCDLYLIAHGIAPDELKLGVLHKNWPKPNASTDEWLRAASNAHIAHGRGNEEAALRAVEAGLRSVQCTGPRVSQFIKTARDVASTIAYDKSERDVYERLMEVATMPDVACIQD